MTSKFVRGLSIALLTAAASVAAQAPAPAAGAPYKVVDGYDFVELVERKLRLTGDEQCRPEAAHRDVDVTQGEGSGSCFV